MTILLPALTLMAQKPAGRAYPTGMYIFCGMEIPRDFYYVVEKSYAPNEWKLVAEIRAPQNAADVKANLLGQPPYFRATMPMPIELSDRIWTRIAGSLSADSLYGYAADPKILAAVGCGWFDDNLTAGLHRYRISKAYTTGRIIVGEVNQPFPENSFKGRLVTQQFKPSNDVVTLHYGLTDSTSTYNLKLYRSRMNENDFRETPSATVYSFEGGRKVAVTRDETVTKGLAYSYFAIPYDALGNMGMASDTINVYNLSSVREIAFVREFNAVADKERRGVSLKWKVESDLYIMGYELFRSRDFDGGYSRIAMLPAETTSYFDDDVDPAVAHFYFMTVHNAYGSSIPSTRTPVVLEGARENLLPPQNLEAVLDGNVVRLAFNSIEPDTRSYQVYRAEGYTGEMTLIASFESPDSVVYYTDTLAQSINPQTLSYAVADVNSSYNISPLSRRASIQYGGGMLPIPSNLVVQQRGSEIFVLWDDMTGVSASVGGYHLYRSTVENGNTVEETQRIATLPSAVNNYFDRQIIPGRQYRYAVESFDFNGEKSNLSAFAGIAIPRQLPLPPGQVAAYAADNRILLRWDNPADPSIRSIRIYRAVLDAPAVLLKELTPAESTFEDRSAKPGEQYFYNVITVNTRNEESRPDDPVSARLTPQTRRN